MQRKMILQSVFCVEVAARNRFVRRFPVHYVMSDIHGHYREYQEMLELIQFGDDDRLFILGDVIDRGPDGGALLMDVLNDNRVTLLLGNHEFMMVQSRFDSYQRNLWLRNGADPTIDQLTDLDQNINTLSEIIYENCPVYIPDLQIDNRSFHLAHAFPIRGYDRPVYMKDLEESLIEVAVWTRDLAEIDSCQYHASTLPLDATFLFGHTPVINCDYCRYDENGRPMISICPGTGFFNIDCGCARDIRLGCLRLEDGREYYLDIL